MNQADPRKPFLAIKTGFINPYVLLMQIQGPR